jgi:hypothetical protein
MNMNTTGSLKALAAFAACATFVATSQAAIVYDNSGTALNAMHVIAPGTQAGDQIHLAPFSSIIRQVTAFQFEYYSELSPEAGKTATLRFFANDGIGGVPGSELYNSGSFDLAGGGYNTVSVTDISVDVPDVFTWTLSVSGLGAGEKVGLLVYNPPTVGLSANDFWVNSANVWSLNQLNSGGTVANFSARVIAVPEPGVVALLALGGIALVATRRNRK